MLITFYESLHHHIKVAEFIVGVPEAKVPSRVWVEGDAEICAAQVQYGKEPTNEVNVSYVLRLTLVVTFPFHCKIIS